MSWYNRPLSATVRNEKQLDQGKNWGRVEGGGTKAMYGSAVSVCREKESGRIREGNMRIQILSRIFLYG